jgi:aspartokinase/homoserine dehydrogenase 1
VFGEALDSQQSQSAGSARRAAGPIVHKFGGTSLGSAERFRAAVRIIADRPEPARLIVVSAMRGVTDALIRLVEQAGGRDPAYRDGLVDLRARQDAVIDTLLEGERAAALREALARDLGDAADVLRAAWVLHHCPWGTADMVSGLGEVWSARLLSACLAAAGEDVDWLDARRVLVAERRDGRTKLDWAASRAKLAAWQAGQGSVPRTLVVTGFIASTPNGAPSTLGRNGSDYSASIFAALFEATELHIWTDVDGVYSANPKLIPEAVQLQTMSYNEAIELAHFGSKVIHPATMGPAVERGIPIYIRNSFRPDGPTTRIDGVGAPNETVKGLSLVEQVALVNVEGAGMSESPAIAQRLFRAIEAEGLEALMVSQGSSQHSICLAVPAGMGERARVALENAFFAELHQGVIQTVEVDPDCAMLAIVGDGMSGHPGLAARFFGAMAGAGINIRAIAQGSSERNISVVVDGAQAVRALAAAHAGLYLARQTLSIGVIGAGVVGSAFLDQLAGQAELMRDRGVDLRVRGLATRSRMVLDDRRLELGAWRESLAGGAPFDIDSFISHLQSDHLPHTVLIDCTSDETLARNYACWLRRGIHVVTPNKKANTLGLDYYRELRQAGRDSGAHFLYEATVGAGLPIIQTLRDLIDTGDEVRRIEGVFSGTLSYLFNAYDGTRPFSELVAEARRNGFTEPDPRDDLSGADVVRKVVILAREMGLEVEPEQVELQGLVPAELGSGSVDDFLLGLRAHDDAMAGRLADARARGEKLRFIGTVERDRPCRVGLRAVAMTSPFAGLTGTDNLARFETRRYTPNPLVVQGPGAGPDVTAGGIFADLLRLTAYLGRAN